MTEAKAGMASAEGEDRSGYQDISSWAGDDFGICKATEATSFTDPTFAANWQGIKAAGIPRGAYHFFHPTLNATDQAKHFLNVVRSHGLEPGDMLVVDSEILAGADGSPALPDPAAGRRLNVVPSGRIANAGVPANGTLAFLDAVLADVGSEHPLLVYSNLSVIPSLAACVRYPLFIAWPSQTAPESVSPWPGWKFWQWQFGGGRGGGDCDAFNGTVAGLHDWLAAYLPKPKHAKPEPGSSPVPPWQEDMMNKLPTLKQGSRDEAGHVAWVHRVQGLCCGLDVPVTIDGDFGPDTAAAVRRLQKAHGIAADGIVGQDTWSALVTGSP
jgi:GH25 family lysozyme M1 (1,4-beta-N-acetylmuramidase)